MLPSINAEDVGNTGLAWLFFSYGYVLFKASELISEGSDLLLLVPSLAGLVGSVVLPLLGAVPDGAIMLFSGLGDIEEAQETLSVGVGALAGSTIMLLTIPWAMSIYAGRVNIVDGTKATYKSKPKLNPNLTMGETLKTTGVSISTLVKEGSKIMVVTTLPYFLIQIPGAYLTEVDPDNVVEGEKMWALIGLIICLIGFVSYLIMQYNIAKKGENQVAQMRQIQIMEKVLESGQFSLSGVLADELGSDVVSDWANNGYGSVSGKDTTPLEGLPVSVQGKVVAVLRKFFVKYDVSKDGALDRKEITIALRSDMNESFTEEDVDFLFSKYDKDKSDLLSFDEFCNFALDIVRKDFQPPVVKNESAAAPAEENEEDEDEEEEEEVPEDLAHLSPAQQQAMIKKRAFTMLFIGTALVLLFSDPMVDVMQEMATRVGISPFYVSFVLAPLASNASEVLASTYYAAKKTSSTMTISLSALEGAAAMNNTFCLSIFMGLIYFRGLAWQYTAETISIVGVQFILAYFSHKPVLTSMDALYILLLFPISILVVAGLEAIGFD
mmetsp:Transcript_14230/g.21900  ORF Transcript_14230/g.21900 Transcript_14230/m.21900 type:complete len:553 (+) Transcript_14230:110-1768(+)|eukprot:CAMPEP_0196811924 /NCGR_PEP_ID=MMETSP1362-20130617/20136_1 /TAXON_ID=163516 /ORGANISM="Leptocylindrus danicus, Strain CCMP1856" /LENGTH=552 /DNA_ID=CAMNT_0042187329 /DNA_START=89 /DNA_END=1747 /DNA_ORIENTATION=+